MAPLEKHLRKLLESTEEAAREAAEGAVQAVFDRLALTERETPESLKNDPLRLQLRERARQLGRGYAEGDVLLENGEAVRKGESYLREELAYEVWHRMLFARFLAETDLLIHPGYGTPVSIADCADLAEEAADGRDAWDLAAEFTASRLPGLFGATGLAARLSLAPEDKQALESLIEKLPGHLFFASDALGWVYQYWQKKKKEEINASERKIGGADLSAVTQLFTEDYMVRFLLENTLGAWWAVRHPESPLLKEWRYLRFREEPLAASPEPLGDGDASPTSRVPAAGSFETWPSTAREVTCMDPCCGSCHFLVVAFEMLRKMRMEEEGLNEAEAANAVLRDNLFGLELDPRCTQIATFALALAAWQVGGEPERFVPHIACSGTPVKGQLKEWERFAKGDDSIAFALGELHRLFSDAPTLGSLIDPRSAIKTEDLIRLDWDRLAAVLDRVTRLEANRDPASSLFGEAAEGAARAAALLGKTYTLVATNPPYLTRGKQAATLARFIERRYSTGKAELATAFILRCLAFAEVGGTIGVVTPQNWLNLGSYKDLRRDLLVTTQFGAVILLGPAAFQDMNWWAATTLMSIVSNSAPAENATFAGIDASQNKHWEIKDELLRLGPLAIVSQRSQHDNPDDRISLEQAQLHTRLEAYADGLQGIATADYDRYGRAFWEVKECIDPWQFHQSTVVEIMNYGGREHIIWWPRGNPMPFGPAARIQGRRAWGSRGVAAAQMRLLPCTLYSGEYFDNNTAVILPHHEEHLPAIWAFCSSPEFNKAVRRIDTKLNVTNATLVKVPFDLAHWQKVADEQYPNGLPEPHSDDPTQWLFNGTVPVSDAPLQVAVARMLGYRWPEQAEDEIDRFIDPDGIVCLPAVSGEQPADARLRALLAAAYGPAWAGLMLDGLLERVDAPDLATWLRDKKGFFAQHARLFHNRPFIWQISDGARDGFSALVNYHKLTPAALQKLIYTYLGDWIRGQRDDAEQGVAGAPGKLEKALELQAKLIAIATGEPDFDIYVRWKSLAEQPIGWAPDLNDGVRLNIRPFVTAGVLHAPFSINWNKDRGKDPARPAPDLSGIDRERRDVFEKHYSVERWNDLHFTIAEKREGRLAAESGPAKRSGAPEMSQSTMLSGSRGRD